MLQAWRHRNLALSVLLAASAGAAGAISSEGAVSLQPGDIAADLGAANQLALAEAGSFARW